MFFTIIDSIQLELLAVMGFLYMVSDNTNIIEDIRSAYADDSKNSYALGARKAYVISDSDFYKHLGFRKYSHYTFYWYTKR